MLEVSAATSTLCDISISRNHKIHINLPYRKRIWAGKKDTEIVSI
jgi:hypothetical protein